MNRHQSSPLPPIDRLISHLNVLKHRPGMYIGSDSNFTLVRCWVNGLRNGLAICGLDFQENLSQCEQDIAREMGGDFNWKSTKHWLEKEYAGEALCVAYLEFEIAVWQRLREHIKGKPIPKHWPNHEEQMSVINRMFDDFYNRFGDGKNDSGTGGETS